jgi:hypothetical protein
MSGLQSSFNSNRHWSGERVAAYCQMPANQFSGLMPVETLQAEARTAESHENEDPLVFIFLIFFLVYALCRVTL